MTIEEQNHANGGIVMVKISRSIPVSLAVMALLVALVSSAPANEVQRGRFVFELETGPVWQTVNDVKIPNTDAATRYSLVDLVGNGPQPSVRLYTTWNINERHGLRLLLAPLQYTESGTFPSPVSFAGATFAANTPTDATYKFNSWRITYNYRLRERERWGFGIGFTAKIRDAKIELAQGALSSGKTDLGFVPLLHLEGRYSFTDRWSAHFDLDALAGGPGRAEDVSVKLAYALTRHLSLTLGYRTLEGGADVDEVYNFAWLHYAVVSLRYRL